MKTAANPTAKKTASKPATTKAAAKPTTTAKPPALPVEQPRTELPVTDPKRKLTKEELRALSAEDRAARRANIRAGKAPAKARIARNIEKTAKKMERLSRLFANDPALKTAMETAVKNMRSVVMDMDDLDESWRPATKLGNGAGGKAARVAASLAVGDTVQVVEKKRAQYAGFIDAADISKLTVHRITGNKVVVVAPSDGSKLFLPANVVEKVVATADN